MPFNNDHHTNYNTDVRALGSDPVLILVVFFTVMLLVGFLLSYFFLPTIGIKVVITISVVSAGIIAALMGNRLMKQDKARKAHARAERIANREAETQKQIDQMHADNSRIPKVTK